MEDDTKPTSSLMNRDIYATMWDEFDEAVGHSLYEEGVQAVQSLKRYTQNHEILIGLIMAEFCRFNEFNASLERFENVTPLEQLKALHQANLNLYDDLHLALDKAQDAYNKAISEKAAKRSSTISQTQEPCGCNCCAGCENHK
jgi:hypothetical protein